MSTLEKCIDLLEKMPEHQIYAVYMFALFVKEHPDVIHSGSLKSTKCQNTETEETIYK